MSYAAACTTVALVASYAFWRLRKILKCPKELQHLPGPPPLANLFAFITGMGYGQRFDKYMRPYIIGAPCTKELLLLHGWTVQMTDQTSMKFLTANPESFPRIHLAEFAKGSMSERFYGKNILFETGDEWKFLRKAVAPAFKRGWDMDSLEGVCKNLVDTWGQYVDQPLDVTIWFPRFAFDALGHGVFTTDFGAILNPDSSMGTLYQDIFEGIMDPLYMLFGFLDTPRNPFRRPVYEKIARFDNLFLDVIKKRRAMNAVGEEMPRDLLTSLLNAQDEGEERQLTDMEIRNNLNIFFLAGHDTTSTTLTGVMYALGANPAVQAKARAEVLHALATVEAGSTPADTIQKLPYLDALIKETLRLYGPLAELNPRRAKEAIVLPSGVVVPAGTAVTGNAWAAHRDPAVFGEDAEIFRPERFMPGGEQAKTQTYAFNMGPHTCIGMNFALVELRLIVTRILEAYTWTLADSSKPLTFGVYNLLKPNSLEVILTSRK